MVSTWKIALATVVIFGTGVVTGGLLVSQAERVKPARAKQPVRHTVPLWPGPVGLAQGHSPEMQQNLERQAAEFIQGLGRELALTEDQRERIKQTIHDGQERSRTTWAKVAPELRHEMDEVKARIRVELTPDQRSRFEEMLKQRQRRKAEEPQGQGKSQRELRQQPPSRDALPGEAGERPPRRAPSSSDSDRGAQRSPNPAPPEKP